MGRNSDTPDVVSELAPYGPFQYVEIEYAIPVRNTPTAIEGPGFYQFSNAPIYGEKCAGSGIDESMPGIFKIGGRCLNYTRHALPQSRYAYTHLSVELSAWPDVFVSCSSVRDVSTESEISRGCRTTAKLGRDFSIISFDDHRPFMSIRNVIHPEQHAEP